jgi:asparagine synthase (glutamine-hydrolysing)
MEFRRVLFRSAEIPEDRVRECLRRMGRRGPDHAAARRWRTPAGRNVHLLHSRLSIIDLDPRANQPFARGSRWIANNGEIYNYREVRQDLERRGETFHTTSDTEVLLAALATEGVSALDRLEGMWAFALYDERDGTSLLSRDRFGEKPLYLLTDDTGLYFGSEVKFIAALRGEWPRVNQGQILRYLVNGYKSLYKTKDTFYHGVRELPAGSCLHVSADGSAREESYWRPRFEPREMSFEDAVAGVRDRLRRAVELRLRADVPLAFCLSGGVDSNVLAGLAKTVFGYDVHGFTVDNQDRRYEEREMVELAVRRHGFRHTWVPSETRDFLPRLRELIRSHDAPVYTITYFAHWRLMSRVAKDGYRVSVSGTGADEIFSGYFDHHLAYLHDVRDDASVAAARAAWNDQVRPFVRNPFLGDPDLFVRDPSFRGHIYLNADDFAATLRRPWSEAFAEERLASDLLRNRMMNEMFHETVPVILHEDDLNAMHYSIENRSPFLDRGLYEFVQSVPTRHLVRNGRAKALLREAARGWAPDEILENPRKVGFNAPIRAFLDADDPSVRSWLGGDGPISELVDVAKVANLLTKPNLPNSESKFLFNFIKIGRASCRERVS